MLTFFLRTSDIIFPVIRKMPTNVAKPGPNPSSLQKDYTAPAPLFGKVFITDAYFTCGVSDFSGFCRLA
jgi:hypothetical protein